MTAYDVAKQIVQRLAEKGFIAYFAGGWVRDHLLKAPSDDIDIATNAAPSQVQKIFPRNVAVGAAFGVIIVQSQGYDFEIASFREDESYQNGRKPTAVTWSTPQEDALRRDFTINGMFYNPLTEEIIDYVGGQEDLRKGIIRAIGNAEQRFAEDRLRMIRAVRFSHRLNFPIEEKTYTAILHHASTLLPAVSMERIWQEFQKMAKFPSFNKALLQLHDLQLLQVIFPELKQDIDKGTLLEKINHLSYLPTSLKVPPILLLMELFLGTNLETKIAICRRLKTTLKDIQLCQKLAQAEQLIQARDKASLADWIRFDAQHDSMLILEFLCNRYSFAEQLAQISIHKQRQAQYSDYIERIQNKKPVVSAALLQQEGIKPGRQMGELLHIAENISINEQITTPVEIIQKLKLSALWTNTF
ncbi:MAG: pcnB3 [Chlamydiales bacterium]|jgi:poly(A) polymerase|nr:pcnB3 [Chlamydiales bacterium]